MHYFGNPRHTHSMLAYKIFTEHFRKFQWKLHCGNAVNMPYWIQILLKWTLNDTGQIRLHSTSHNNTLKFKEMMISKKDIILVGSLIQPVVFWYTDLYISRWPKWWLARPKYYSTDSSEIYTLGKRYQTYKSKSISPEWQATVYTIWILC